MNANIIREDIMDRNSVVCSICNNVSDNKHYTIYEKMYKMRSQGFDYLLCSRCGTLQLKSHLDDPSVYYPKSYGGFYKVKEYTVFDRLRHRFVAKLVLDYGSDLKNKEFAYLNCMKGIHIRKDAAILDLGCGSGRWLDQLSMIGFTNLTGVDLYNDRKDKLSYNWTFLSGEIYDVKSKYDVITLHHSYEHMKDPLNVLRRIKDLLKDNGLCIIRIPVMGKYAWRCYQENWVQIDAPRHLYLYTEQALNYLGKKAGLNLVKVKYDSDEFQFWGSEIYIRKNINLKTAEHIKKSLFPDITLNRYKIKANQLNSLKDGDQAIFYYVKR